MSANVETMVSVREVPWHRLGKVVKDNLTAGEAIIEGGLNWTNSLHPLFIRGQNEIDGIPVIGKEAVERKAVVRNTDGSILGVVGNGYHIIQNVDCFNFMDDVIGSGQAVYETAGSLNGGKTIFMTVKLPNDAKIGPDHIEKYLLLSTSHDGSSSLQVLWTPIRVVCVNTLNAALRSRTEQAIKIKHTKNYKKKVEQAREVLKLTDHYYSIMETEWNRLLDTQMNNNEMIEFADTLIPSQGDPSTKTKNNRKKLVELFHEGRGQKDVANTRWAAFNAVTEYVDYFRTVRKHGDTTDDEARMGSSIYGSGADLKQRAFDLLKIDPKIQTVVA